MLGHLLLIAAGMLLLAYALQLGQPHTVQDWTQAGDLDWLPLDPPASEAAARVSLFIAFAVLTAAHFSLLRTTRALSATRWALTVVLVGAVVLSLLSAVNTQALSNDISSYIIYGRMAAEHGLNPMVVSPEAVSSDPFFDLVSPRYQDAVSVYGPYWVLLSAAVTVVVEALGGSLELYVAAYRAVMTAGLLLSAWAVWTILGRLAPSYQVAGTLLFAWSPLVLVETSALHNDIVMVGLLMAGAALLVIKRPYWAIALMLIAVLVKWVAVIPMLILMTAWLASLPSAERLRAVAKSAGVALVVAVPPLLYFGEPVDSLMSPFSEAGSGVRNTLSELVIVVLSRVTGMTTDELEPLVELASRVAVAATVITAVVLAWRRPSMKWALTISTGALLILLLVAPRFWPWYAIWPLALAPSSLPSVRWTALTLSYTAPLIYVLYPTEDDPSPLSTARSLFVFGPPIAVFALGFWKQRRAGRTGEANGDDPRQPAGAAASLPA